MLSNKTKTNRHSAWQCRNLANAITLTVVLIDACCIQMSHVHSKGTAPNLYMM